MLHHRTLAGAVRGVVAQPKNKSTCENILTTAHQVMDQSFVLITEAKNAVENPNESNKQMRLDKVVMKLCESGCCYYGYRQLQLHHKHWRA